jgi:hypothetical protein
LLVIGYWLLVAGYWLMVVGCWLLVIGCWLCYSRVKDGSGALFCFCLSTTNHLAKTKKAGTNSLTTF